MVAHERQKELSILRALGAKKVFVIRLILVEAFTLAIIGGLIGIGVAFGILFLFQDFIRSTLEIPFIVPAPLTLLFFWGAALLLTMGIAGISSLYQVILVTRTKPYEAIRRGES